jgi:hypothetical protein
VWWILFIKLYVHSYERFISQRMQRDFQATVKKDRENMKCRGFGNLLWTFCPCRCNLLNGTPKHGTFTMCWTSDIRHSHYTAFPRCRLSHNQTGAYVSVWGTERKNARLRPLQDFTVIVEVINFFFQNHRVAFRYTSPLIHPLLQFSWRIRGFFFV